MSNTTQITGNEQAENKIDIAAPFEKTFNNLNMLNDMILERAGKMLKDDIEQDKLRLQEIINGEKPEHFTDEQWEKHKELGRRIMNL